MRRSVFIVAALLALAVVACSGPTSEFTRPTQTLPSPDEARSHYVASPQVEDSLLILGDWGSGTSAEATIAESMQAFSLEHPVQAILTTGDNLYSDDWDDAMDPFRWAADSDIAFWVTWGNHDIESPQRVAAMEAAFADPPLWATIEWGGIDIVILDSNDVDSVEQEDYLAAEMTRIDRPTIVVLHEPPFSCASPHHDNTEEIDTWLPLFDSDVVLVLSGHSHDYQRFEDAGIPYVVTGGGGRSLDDLEDCPSGHLPRIVGESSYNWITLTQEPGDLVLRAIGLDGVAIDEVSIPLGAVTSARAPFHT